MEAFSILHHGAVRGVTGSCHELRLGEDYGVLIDCGLFQGAESSGQGADAENLQIEFPIGHIKALVVTHVHIDHVGRIPYLLAAGFRGPILCSQPSAELLPLVLEDAVKVGFTRDADLVKRFLRTLRQRIIGLPFDHWFNLLDDGGRRLRVRLQRAGHILGSAYVEFDVESTLLEPLGPMRRRVIFSGDLGAPHAPILPEPKVPERCDTLVIESTYGDRVHEDRLTRQARLREVIERAVANSGVVLVPAFSIGRTQELIYELESIIAEGGKTWERMAIVVDSPLANRFTEVYRKLKPLWDEEAQELLRKGRDPLNFDQLLTVGTHIEHQRLLGRLQQTHEPCIVIAASGMCAGGRIVNYLKALVGDPRTDVLFVGYQAAGTPGRMIQDGARHVYLDGERYAVRAGVYSIGGYSAHADQADLVRFATTMASPPSEIRIVHGDPAAKTTLQQKLQAALPTARLLIP